jgi:hypothetical protein
LQATIAARIDRLNSEAKRMPLANCVMPPPRNGGNDNFILFLGESYIRLSRIQQILRNQIDLLTSDTIA